MKRITLRSVTKSMRLFITKHDALLIVLGAMIIAGISVAHNYYSGTILAYGDAESHINIAKRVVSSITPGFGQLGGIWLPIHHLIMVPFVISDFMWRTGLGGAIASAICFVIATYFVYKLAYLLTKKRWIALLSTAIFALNPNVLYMLGTPMSELPLLAFMTGSLYYFVKWMFEDDVRMLTLAAFLSFGGILVRYDAWFLFAVQVAAVVAVGLYRKYGIQKTSGTAILFTLPALLAVGLWLLWGLIIFHDPFYFMNSEYSAKSQQQAFLSKGELPTYHNLWQSVQYYSQAVIDNIGIVLTILAVIGLIILIVRSKKKHIIRTLSLAVLLLAPFIFNVLSLFLGISILFIPELTPASFEFHLFNIRYGMMMVPAVAILIGYLISTFTTKSARVIAGVTAVSAVAVFMFTFPITLKDGTEGLSAREINTNAVTIATDFNSTYDYGYLAYDDYHRAVNAIDINIPMNRIIYVGSHPYWDTVLEDPSSIARYIIMQPDDALWKKFHNNDNFNQHYELLSTRRLNIAGSDADVYLYKCTSNCTTKYR